MFTVSHKGLFFLFTCRVTPKWSAVSDKHLNKLPSHAGPLQVTMYEKSCAVPSQCGVSGQKFASGLYFNYTNICCDTDLCNGAESFAALSWRGGAALCLLPALSLLLA